MALTIVFASKKGGVGKTTLLYNISSLLVDWGYKCLLVDLDSQAHSTIHAGFEPLRIEYGIYNAIVDYLLKNSVNEKSVIEQDGLYLIPSNEKTALLDQVLERQPCSESILKDFLMEFDGHFDYIFIDTPPSTNTIVVNALVASHYLLIPVRLDFFSLVGLAHMMNFYYRINATISPYLKLLGLIPVSFSHNARISKEVLTELQKTFGARMILPILRNDIKIVEASSHGKPIHRYAPKSRAAADIAKIAQEILRRIDQR